MRILLISFLLFWICGVQAQDKWDLRRCVEHAMQHNLTVKQADVQARLAELQRKQLEAGKIPSLSFNTNLGYNFGRSIDPTSNQFVTQKVFFQGLNLQTTLPVFNFFSLKNNIESSRLNEQSEIVGVDRAKNDVALLVAGYYLQLVLSIEQQNLAELQVAQTASQLQNTLKLVEAGNLPELNAAQLAAQLARDSSSLISAFQNVINNKMLMRAALNLDAEMPFEVSVPDIDLIPLESLVTLQPGLVYADGLKKNPTQIQDSLRIISAEYGIKSARGAMYPTLSFFGSIGSNYASTFRQFAGAVPNGNFDTVAVVPVNGVDYYALTPGFDVSLKRPGYFKQMSDINLQQNFGLSLSVPIFNSRQLKTNYNRSKLNLISARLTQLQDRQNLQQNVYKAYSDVIAAKQKLEADTRSEVTASYAFDLSKKRFDAGLLSTIEYIITQNDMFRSRIQKLLSKYDFIFKVKVLEFYRGDGIKL
jgi:outer membrane protein